MTHRIPALVSIGLSCLAFDCSSRRAGAPDPTASPDPAAVASSTTPAPITPTPPPGPRVIVRNASTPGAVDIVAQGAVELDSNLIVEQQTPEGTWQPLHLDLDSMKLVEKCGQSIGACVSLEAGRTIRPVAWSGMSCSSQCNHSCDKNVYRGGSPLRFVVKTCDGKERFEGAPFEPTTFARSSRSRSRKQRSQRLVRAARRLQIPLLHRLGPNLVHAACNCVIPRRLT
jgi:hypothetical protein